MFSQGNSLSMHPNHNKIFLSPIKRSKKRKILEQKQKQFILDCTNTTKSKLQQYNYLKDKYLNYCVVKIPKRKRIIAHSPIKNANTNKQNINTHDHNHFKHFLQSKRQQILAQSSSLSKQLNVQKQQSQQINSVKNKQPQNIEPYQNKVHIQQSNDDKINSSQEYNIQQSSS